MANKPLKKRSDKRQPKITGWLIIPTIALIFNAIYYTFFSVLGIALISMDYIENFRILEIINLILFSLITILLLVLEYLRNKKFPVFFIIFLPIVFISNIIYDSFNSGINIYEPILYIIFSVILTAYFTLSKRVKNTFVK